VGKRVKELKMDIKIKLKVKDVEIELSLDELKELKEVIEELTEKKVQYVPYQIPTPYPVYTKPYRYWETKWDTMKTSGTSSPTLKDNTYTVMYKG